VNADPTRILVVDDSALYRQSIHNVLREVPVASIVGIAKNGVEALEKIEQLDPDLLTLDVQMPDMDGIQVLREMKRRRLRAKAIMVSSLTCEGAKVTTDALMEGAFDFILKPSSGDSDANRQQLKDALEEKISAFRTASGRGRRRSRRPVASRPVAADDVVEAAPAPVSACQAVIIGASTGGPEAFKVVLPKLPASLPVPVLVVQHMPPQFTRSLATRLDEICELEVVEAGDKTEAVAGRLLIAPGDRQMKLQREGEGILVRINNDPHENGVRPSIDYLMRSVSDVLGGSALAVIMTGMGRDGLEGCRRLKQAGGYVFAQSQDDCVVYGMPKAVIEQGLADRALPLGKIAPAIVRHLKRSRRS
jgi:two-component system chemotaxis response regulator CheB